VLNTPTASKNSEIKVAVIGTGYVGLTTGACFARLGHTVVCADIVPEKVESLSRGMVPILEEGIEELVTEGIESGRLSFVLGAETAARDCDFAFMCVPTPQGEDGSADLSYLIAAAKEIAGVLPSGVIVVNKSTVPVGSAEKVHEAIGRTDITVASNPEFLREGTSIRDFFNPDRIVIGAPTDEAALRVAELYTLIEAPKLLVDTKTAELIKYASNAFLAAKLTFANSVAALSESIGANAHEVLAGVGHDSRIGRKFLAPGPGWGGSCFPKDVYALIRMSEEAGYDFDLLHTVLKTNQVHVDRIIDKARGLLGGELRGAKVAVWGLTYKAGTDDVRESPAVKIVNHLLEAGAKVTAYDPGIKSTLAGVTLAHDAFEATEDADLLMVLTEWPEFGEASLIEVSRRMKKPRVIDTRNVLDIDELRLLGFMFYSVGYGTTRRSELKELKAMKPASESAKNPDLSATL
jgi:UDPglucose 6-dehydrogenase